ncbi:MAG: M48 family metalloprotease [Desulfamplus sp.]|nr:M48 family metalloprotease [Desulfamplus sp.]
MENYNYGIFKTVMNRRQFLQYSALAGAGAMLPSGCAVNPVTGKNQLMIVSQDQEIAIDRQHSPHQFSADYGIVQDTGLNRYIGNIGRSLALGTHRPSMPYSFQCVNATYINAYAFPGGTIAVTRGILLELKNEAELAALLGHELGHVNARHSAEQMSRGTLTSLVVGGLALAIGSRDAQMGEIAQQLGMLGQGVLLARYSRENEREADDLGNRYMVDAGYSTHGFVGLMSLLNDMNKGRNAAADMLFSTHPMGSERYETALRNSRERYGPSASLPLNRDRYMDNTARIRNKKEMIKTLQDGDTLMAAKKYDEAFASYKRALRLDPGDYTARIMAAKSLLVKKDYKNAMKYAEEAEKLYPSEGQALHVAGFAAINLKRYDHALEKFNRYDQILPGSPGVIFFKGYALEGMQRIDQSASHYKSYLQQVQQGDYAQHAYRRLKEWGYL